MRIEFNTIYQVCYSLSNGGKCVPDTFTEYNEAKAQYDEILKIGAPYKYVHLDCLNLRNDERTRIMGEFASL